MNAGGGDAQSELRMDTRPGTNEANNNEAIARFIFMTIGLAMVCSLHIRHYGSRSYETAVEGRSTSRKTVNSSFDVRKITEPYGTAHFPFESF